MSQFQGATIVGFCQYFIFGPQCSFLLRFFNVFSYFFVTLPLHHLSSHPFLQAGALSVGVWVCVYAKACPPSPPPHTHTYDTHVSMPRCFMAKKLKYPYQEWKERQDPVDTGGSRSNHVTPETDQRATKKLGNLNFYYFRVL